MAPKAKGKKDNLKKATHDVVGVAHRITVSTRKLIAQKIREEGPLGAILVREKDNPADENAIKVVLEHPPYNEMHIGYIPRQIAKVYSPAWDAGEMEITRVVLTAMKPSEGTGEIKVKFRVNRKPRK